MKSRATRDFWRHYDRLPEEVQESAQRAFRIWRDNPYHPSLQFKRVHDRAPIFSVRVGRRHRALGRLVDDTIIWYWIGGHAEYDTLLD